MTREDRKQDIQPEEPTEFVWTVMAAEGDVAVQLERAQARAINEVLAWVAKQHRSRPISSEPDPGEGAGPG
ncbi:hypothetical protein [Actinomadura sp. 9N407]|uniref:hypothetical protein n=1 Tax=Actinomadura sp. 9N407 TaxID=3375154 RepID=UPI003787447F